MFRRQRAQVDGLQDVRVRLPAGSWEPREVYWGKKPPVGDDVTASVAVDFGRGAGDLREPGGPNAAGPHGAAVDIRPFRHMAMNDVETAA